MQIIMDDRERVSILIERLQTQFSVTCRRERLKYGDYKIPPDTIVERKTTHDFCVSLIQGRLFRQAYWLAECTDNPILLIEGESFANKNISLACIRGALATLAQSFRLPVLRTHDEAESAWLLACLAKQRRRLAKNHGPLHGYKPRRLHSQKLQVLRCFPGIGPKLAQSLLDRFGTVEKTLTASAEELQSVPGIGKETASQIKSILHESPGIYNCNSAVVFQPRSGSPAGHVAYDIKRT